MPRAYGCEHFVGPVRRPFFLVGAVLWPQGAFGGTRAPIQSCPQARAHARGCTRTPARPLGCTRARAHAQTRLVPGPSRPSPRARQTLKRRTSTEPHALDASKLTSRCKCSLEIRGPLCAPVVRGSFLRESRLSRVRRSCLVLASTRGPQCEGEPRCRFFLYLPCTILFPVQQRPSIVPVPMPAEPSRRSCQCICSVDRALGQRDPEGPLS
jgi:hypothetical protein